MELIAAREGDFYGILAHSFGTLIASYAIVKYGFPPAGKLIYFGSLNRLMDTLPRFQALARLPDSAIEGLAQLIFENYGRETVESIIHETYVPRMPIPALMFHDTSDKVTPIEDSRAIARVWPTARLVETEGLGHRGALQSEAIHAQIVQFLHTS